MNDRDRRYGIAEALILGAVIALTAVLLATIA